MPTNCDQYMNLHTNGDRNLFSSRTEMRITNANIFVVCKMQKNETPSWHRIQIIFPVGGGCSRQQSGHVVNWPGFENEFGTWSDLIPSFSVTAAAALAVVVVFGCPTDVDRCLRQTNPEWSSRAIAWTNTRSWDRSFCEILSFIYVMINVPTEVPDYLRRLVFGRLGSLQLHSQVDVCIPEWWYTGDVLQ